jgi:tRNA pseudouridine55 synthase
VNKVGLLLVDKPEGPTSHDVIGHVRKALGTRRVGHTGTLDPFASGLLVLCFGWATRLAEYLVGLPKAYRAVARLGARTETDDRTGSVISNSDAWHSLSEDDIRVALSSQLGEIDQIPPDYSAKKVDGRRAYAVAREGGSPRLRAQRVTIGRLELTDYAPPDAAFDIECSSGTYVRAVARDLGEALGVGAHLTLLRRMRIGEFSLDDAIRVERDTPAEAIERHLLAPQAAVRHLPRAELGATASAAISHGQAVDWAGEASGPVAVFFDGQLIAIGESASGQLLPRKVFGAAA